MIRASSGISTGGDIVECAENAARSAMRRLNSSTSGKADIALVFTSGDHPGAYLSVLQTIRGICGTSNLAGCSGAGILTDEREVEGDGGVAVLAVASDSLRARPFFVKDLRGRDREAGREIGRLLEPMHHENPMLVLFPDTLSLNPEQLFLGIHEVAGPVPVVGGGAACGSGTGGTTHQFCGGDAATNAVSGVILTGSIVCSVGVTQSCLPVGRARRVTSAVGNSIKSLDGMPAVRALLESLAGGPGREITDDLPRLAPHVFVAFPPGLARDLKRGQYVVRNILGVDPDDGSIFVGREIEEGDILYFALRDPDGARDDLKAMLEENLPLAGQPAVGLYFNCCARGSGLYGLPDIDTAYIRNCFSELPLAGFFGYAEIASLLGRARLHNYTGVMALVSEAPRGARAS
ncbi:MAG TPA: FIST N-terminal domain-containing protein [Candidatus Polarisedimenticolia bacterium]|nr:FIST N-terminal domain-containing protein [Candidatus Polarisedimenticolia bacterium]